MSSAALSSYFISVELQGSHSFSRTNSRCLRLFFSGIFFKVDKDPGGLNYKCY